MDKIQVIENLLHYIFPYSFLLPVPIYLILFRKVKSDAVCNIVIAYAILFCLLNVFFESIPREYRKTYYFSYTFFEYLSFASIFYLRTVSRGFRIFIIVMSSLFVAFQAYFYFFERQVVLDSIPIGISTILIFIFIINYLLQEFRITKDHFIYSDYIFWISVGVMSYLGLTFFFNILANEIKDSTITKYWDLTFILDIVKNILFAYAIFIANRKPKINSTKSSSVPYLDMV